LTFFALVSFPDFGIRCAVPTVVGRARSIIAGRVVGSFSRSQRHILRVGGEFLENSIVNRELIPGVILARVGVRHQQRNGRTLDGVGEICQEFSPTLDHGVAFARAGVELQQLRMQLRTARSIRKSGIQQGEQLRRPRTMEVRHGSHLFLGVLRSGLSCIQNQRQNPIQIARPLIHVGDVAIHREFARTETNRGLRSGQQKTGETGDRLLLRIGQVFTVAVVERKVIACRLRVGVNVFEQPRTDVEFLRSPRRLGGFLVQPKISNGLLSNVGFALLLVVIENTGRGVEIFRIGDESGMGVIAELAQVLRLAQKIEITFHQLRIPERLKTLLVY